MIEEIMFISLKLNDLTISILSHQPSRRERVLNDEVISCMSLSETELLLQTSMEVIPYFILHSA
jgi:hypothetical protein